MGFLIKNYLIRMAFFCHGCRFRVASPLF